MQNENLEAQVNELKKQKKAASDVRAENVVLKEEIKRLEEENEMLVAVKLELEKRESSATADQQPMRLSTSPLYPVGEGEYENLPNDSLQSIHYVIINRCILERYICF